MVTPSTSASNAVSLWSGHRPLPDLHLIADGGTRYEDVRPDGAAKLADGRDDGRRVTVDGKQFAVCGRRFRFRGVTWGTFRPRAADGARYPDRALAARDLSVMADAGFTVVRTYTAPPSDVVEQTRRTGLRLLPTAFYEDWRYMVGASRRQAAAITRAARQEVRRVAERLAGDPAVVALSLGNELPADVIRWVGSRRVEAALASLVDVAREVDPGLLLTYGSYPTAEHLDLPDLDFLMFNVYLERPDDLRRYLTRLHHLAGDRPLVLGEIGCDSRGSAAGEEEQAASLSWQLETAVERGVAGTCVFSWTDEWFVGDAPVVGWNFGLTTADRAPKPALGVATRWNHRTVADLDADWPSVSVVVCAYQAASTLAECLGAACAIDYPCYEVVVVDDGSSDATAAIAASFPGVRLVRIAHAGLGAARNAGIASAGNDLVAFLDSDAYPPPEWLRYLALGLDAATVGGVGGPNLPPPSDPVGAHAVAQSPGGPAHVLTEDNRAEHVPGCNMAFWKDVLGEVGSFDPVYQAAGDDVDVCWKVLDAGWEIGFHPAAVVWHHRRPGMRAYLRQQRGYGRAEALVAARHPHRYTRTGSARWRGRIYLPGTPRRIRQRVYRGAFGAAAFQSVYAGRSDGWDLAHQLGVPAAVATVALLPAALIAPLLAVPAVAAAAFLVFLWAVSAVRARPPVTARSHHLRFRSLVASLHLLQPAARMVGRFGSASRGKPDRDAGTIPGPAQRRRRGILLLPAEGERADLARQIVACLAGRGLRGTPPTGWEPYDVRLRGSLLVQATLLTTAFPAGAVQVRLARRLAPARSVVAAGAVTVALGAGGLPARLLVAGLAADVVRGLWRTGPGARRAIVARAGRTSAPGDTAQVIDLEAFELDARSGPGRDLLTHPATARLQGSAS